MVEIANPIYDIVFKYLMEDERIAVIFLSALLKKEVVSVEMRRNEYSNQTRDHLSNFRIDFGARVQEEDGSVRLILIELQKTWVETEILRFRQYMGVQYSNSENMQGSEESPYAIPMVSVYLLGHRVKGLKEPVLYVNRKCFDYDGNEVTDGLPDRFIDSLTHDSIIVQIPRIGGRRFNRLERVLSVFDQSLTGSSSQILNIDETTYGDDSDIHRIIGRLQTAATNAEIRQNMTVEEEFFSAIYNRDAKIADRDATIAAKDATIASNEAAIANSVRLLLQSGVSMDRISESLKMDQQQIQALLDK